MKIYYKSDFKIVENVDVDVPFIFTYYVWRNVKVASFDGKTYTGCVKKEDGSVVVPFDRELCELGTLKCRREFFLKDNDFADGVCNKVTDGEVLATVTDAEGNTHQERVELVDEVTDGDVEVESVVESGGGGAPMKVLDVTAWFNKHDVKHSVLFPDYTPDELVKAMRARTFPYQLRATISSRNHYDVCVDYSVDEFGHIAFTAFSPDPGLIVSEVKTYHSSLDWWSGGLNDLIAADNYNLKEIKHNAEYSRDLVDNLYVRMKDAETKLSLKQDSLDEDTIIKGELYKDDGSGEVVPVRHPDLSTQPSILPYKFAGNYVYEQIVFIPKSILGEKSTTLDVAYLVEKPIILDARLSIFRENFRRTTSPYCEVEVDSIDPKSVKTTILYRDNSGMAELNDAWLRIVYTSQPKSNGGYYYYNKKVEEKEFPSGIYVSLPPYMNISGLYGASEGVLIKERPFDVPAGNSLWFIPDEISNVGSIQLRDCSFEGNWDNYRGIIEDANTKEEAGYAVPYYESGTENYGVGIVYRGENVTHTLITLYSI